MMTAYLHPAQEIARSGRTFWERTVPAVLGHSDITIRSTGTWTMTSQVATSFRRGRLLLAGDAAHRFPHTGGFGLNSGVQDADNLAWKLEAVLNGGAAPGLLDTYESERKPVVERFAAYSVANHEKLDEVTKPLGVSNRALGTATRVVGRAPFRWVPDRIMAPLAERAVLAQTGRTADLGTDSARGRHLRTHVASTVPDQLEHFVATGLEFGYCYTGALTAPSAGEEPMEGDGIRHHVPTTWPGRRLPHTDVFHADRSRPIHHLVRPRGLTVLTGDASAWTDSVRELLANPPFPLEVVAIRSDARTAGDQRLHELLEVGDFGSVVVRPDGHVVWRSDQPAAKAAPGFVQFLHQQWFPLWGRPSRGNPMTPLPLRRQQTWPVPRGDAGHRREDERCVRSSRRPPTRSADAGVDRRAPAVPI